MTTISISKGETPNETTLTLPGITIWFSYETPVAFRTSDSFQVRENDWGTTTSKHLNRIDGGRKDGRIPGAVFERLLDLAIDRTLLRQAVRA